MFRRRYLCAWNWKQNGCILYELHLARGSDSAAGISLLGNVGDYHLCKHTDTIKNANCWRAVRNKKGPFRVSVWWHYFKFISFRSFKGGFFLTILFQICWSFCRIADSTPDLSWNLKKKIASKSNALQRSCFLLQVISHVQCPDNCKSDTLPRRTEWSILIIGIWT